MTQEEIKNSKKLPGVILSLIETNSAFKDLLKTTIPSIAADVESAATNPNCSCRERVNEYVTANSELVGAFLYEYIISNNLQDKIKSIFEAAQVPPVPASGRVAKTTVKDWPEFAKSVNKANLSYRHMSTSIVGDDVYVFFL